MRKKIDAFVLCDCCFFEKMITFATLNKKEKVYETS